MAIKLAIVSKIRLFSEAVAKLVEDDPDITIVCEPGRVTALEDLMALHSQVALIDHLAFYDMYTHILAQNGFDAKMILIESRTEPLLIDGTITELISKGVIAGILSADASGEHLKKAVKVVAAGQLWIDHLTIKNILNQAMFVKKSFTRQESEIAGLILHGFCNKEIARELKIAEATVKSHCNRLFKKFNVSGRLQLGLKLSDGLQSL
jgi:DNA-binding NarL/FixJ family response regulator